MDISPSMGMLKAIERNNVLQGRVEVLHSELKKAKEFCDSEAHFRMQADKKADKLEGLIRVVGGAINKCKTHHFGNGVFVQGHLEPEDYEAFQQAIQQIAEVK